MRGYSILSTFHTGFTVSDLERTVTFFQDVLGFEVTGRDDADPAFMERLTGVEGAGARLVFLKAPGHSLEILEYSGPKDRRRSELRPCDAGFAHITFTVDNIEAVVAASRAAGFSEYRPIVEIEDGPAAGTKAVYMRDADGLTIEFIEWPEQQP